MVEMNTNVLVCVLISSSKTVSVVYKHGVGCFFKSPLIMNCLIEIPYCYHKFIYITCKLSDWINLFRSCWMRAIKPIS